MAAGLGFKTFTTGEVLTAADVNGYLMQGILVFANAAARTSAVTSPQEGQYSYLKDTNALEYYDGAAWVGAPVGDITAVTAGTGISGGGSSGAVTITNDMATTITASGDIVVGTGSGTYDNLPIGTTGQVLTADTTVSPYKVKWATAASGTSFSGCELTNSGNNYSIANNTWTKVTFNQETYDVGGYAAAGSTITIPSGKGGYYLVCGWGYWDQNATGNRLMKIYKNGTGVYQDRGWITNASAYPTSSIRNVVSVSASDTIEIYVFQSSGGALNFYVYPADAGLSVAFLGA